MTSYLNIEHWAVRPPHFSSWCNHLQLYPVDLAFITARPSSLRRSATCSTTSVHRHTMKSHPRSNTGSNTESPSGHNHRKPHGMSLPRGMERSWFPLAYFAILKGVPRSTPSCRTNEVLRSRVVPSHPSVVLSCLNG